MEHVLSYLSEQKKTNKEFAAEWTEIELLFNDEQWNELTKKMISLLNHPVFQNEDSLVQLYHNFISSFETKINPYELVEIASVITSFMSDKKEAVEFLEKIEEKVKICDEAVCFCWVLQGQIHLEHFQDLVATKKIIDDLDLVLKELVNVPVYAKIFLFALNYYRQVGGQHSDDYHQLESKFNKEIIRQRKEFDEKNSRQQKEFDEKICQLKIEIESKFMTKAVKQEKEFDEKISRQQKEFDEKNSRQQKEFDEKISRQQKEFDEKICKLKIEIESKFMAKAVRNFDEVIKSQTENDSLRKLNEKIIFECSQLRIKNRGLEEVNTKLEKDLLNIKSEQEQQKQVLLLLAARMKKLKIKSDDGDDGDDGADPKDSS